MAEPTARDVGTFIREIFVAGQSELQAAKEDPEGAAASTTDEKGVVNGSRLVVLTNAVCVDILVWATNDEQGICGYLLSQSHHLYLHTLVPSLALQKIFGCYFEG